ncbi:helix-turn-helix domain-containing protein [Streptomyces acidiscabies]|uniref:helix-turn-helix domain-containing protein n=1 Tax=Streptomyces acidiscabies TaxID=42234 RepID=UPI000952ECE2|nr:helix-turn-helix transcriptional regulator [Streptomyces acidiscabies]
MTSSSPSRTEAGLTKRALAVRLGWHESKCSRFESGTRPPSERNLREWTTARGIDGMYVEWRKMERTGLKQAQESVLPLVDPRPRTDGLVHQRSAHFHPRPPWPHRRCAGGRQPARHIQPHRRATCRCARPRRRQRVFNPFESTYPGTLPSWLLHRHAAGSRGVPVTGEYCAGRDGHAADDVVSAPASATASDDARRFRHPVRPGRRSAGRTRPRPPFGVS